MFHIILSTDDSFPISPVQSIIHIQEKEQSVLIAKNNVLVPKAFPIKAKIQGAINLFFICENIKDVTFMTKSILPHTNIITPKMLIIVFGYSLYRLTPNKLLNIAKGSPTVRFIKAVVTNPFKL